MPYYTERHGMRSPVEKTYEVSHQMYALLFGCCEKYYNNLAWKYPKYCTDGYGCCGLDFEKFNTDMTFEIPDLFKDRDGTIAVPTTRHNVFSGSSSDSYVQEALFDYIEFFANNIRDVVVGSFHSYMQHHHLTLLNTSKSSAQFCDEINEIFRKTGLLYVLNDNYEIEKILTETPITEDVLSTISAVKESGTKELLQEAILLHKSPHQKDNRDAVEKLWDAFERMKTYYLSSSMDKKASITKIVNDVAGGQADSIDLFNEEFKKLTDIGNKYRIRHHETDKIDITDSNYYDYFFNRCLSLIVLTLQYLK